MPKGIPRKPGEEQQLEGGGAGAGMSSVKQFEKSTPMADRAQAKIDKANRMARERASDEALLEATKNTPKTVSEMTDAQKATMTPGQLSRREQADKNFAELQARKTTRKQPNLFEMTDKERAALTPSQKRRYGSDMLYARPGVDNMDYKKGGKVSASSRADGCAVKGKTKGRFV